MTVPLVWPAEFYYDPIGNTSATCLTRDLPPEAPANILVLNSTDCRNVLFTVHCELVDSRRKLDFTCSDVDPGNLARATLLFTMVVDSVSPRILWNIFFHVYLDEPSLTLLASHCRKLTDAALTLQDWNGTIYGAVIRFGSEHTFAEVRRLLSLYADTEKSRPPPDALGKTAEERRKEAREHKTSYRHSSARSSGPMHAQAARVYDEAYDVFCDTRTTFVNRRDLARATLCNPTFCYSRHGSAATLHPCLDPMAPFHLAPAFGDGHPDSVTVSDLVKAARAEFSSWCASVHDAASHPNGRVVVRFLLGDPLVVARALEYLGQMGEVESNMFVAQWSMCRMVLSSEEYAERGAPTTFDAIDTSTLWDTVGIFNLLSTTVPLLSVTSGYDSVLYTESLVAWENNQKTKIPGYHFESFTADISLWFDLCPVDYLSGFTCRYNAHETLQYEGYTRTRRHEVVSWKRPCSGDRIARKHPTPHMKFQSPDLLAAHLEVVYFRLFGDMGCTAFFAPGADLYRRERQYPDVFINTRESFVRFLRCARDRFCDSMEEWEEVVSSFFSRITAVDRLDFLSHVELFTELHRLGVGDIEGTESPPKPTSGRLSAWDSIPSLVRVTLVVPRAQNSEALTAYVRGWGASPLIVFIGGIGLTGYIQGLNAGFGRATDVGTEASPRIQLDEDPEGFQGTSDLIVSFVVCTGAFTDPLPKPDSEITISLCFMAAPQSLPNNEKPIQVCMFKEPFEDRNHVLVAPEPSSHAHWPCPWLERRSHSNWPHGSSLPIGEQTYVKIESTKNDSDDSDGEEQISISGMVARVEVQNPRARELYLTPGRFTLNVSHVSPCVMRARIGDSEQEQDIVFPVPIIGSLCELRLPQKCEIDDLHVELYVPIAKIVFEKGGYKLDPIPTISSSDGSIHYPWSIHRVNLDRMPVVNEDGLLLNDWLDEHVWAQRSITDCTIDVMHKGEPPNWNLPKQSLFCVLYRPFTTHGRLTGEGKPFRVMALSDWSQGNTGERHTDTFLFLSELRYDLSAHTVVADAYVLTVIAPLTHDTVECAIADGGGGQIGSVSMSSAEMLMWKRLLPAAAERCRTWSHGPNCEYTATGRVPLEDEMHKGNPLCSCGRGQDVGGMLRVAAWRPLAQYATRIALSPLFPVWYLEPLMRKLLRLSGLVNKEGKPKENPRMPIPVCKMCRQARFDLKRCTRCQSVTYCSQRCQKKDWPMHKAQCKPKAK
ncbi:hypothetical protein C8Q80DRAFT_467409 [Daedaleopsis nitida]|nr:hypothetical protein C8Q80DRAFT_467409 [Daedaleopsis nitida]